MAQVTDVDLEGCELFTTEFNFDEHPQVLWRDITCGNGQW
jgi:hypothetical protein